MSLTVLLHTAPEDAWGAWLGEPVAVVGVLAASWCYARGTSDVWRQVGRGRLVTRWHVVAWAVAVASLLVAVASPLEAVAGSLFSAHMLQHVLLTTVAAPLVVLSRPVLPLRQGLPHGLRRRAARWHGRARGLRRLTYAGVWPLAAAGAYALVTVLWHLPGPYQAAVGSDLVHAAEHASLLGVGVLLWWVVRETGRRSEFGYGVGILVVFAVAITHTAVGAVLTFAPHVLYAHYATTAGTWGLSPLFDQHLAGVVMWAPGKVVHGVVVVVLAVAWLRAVEARASARSV